MISRHPIKRVPMIIKSFLLSFFVARARQTVQFTYDSSGNGIKKEFTLSTVRSSEVKDYGDVVDNAMDKQENHKQSNYYNLEPPSHH